MALDLLVKAGGKPVRSSAALHPLETEVVDFFVQLARLLGLSKSIGEIYGLLFISVRPLAMDDLVERLKLSKGCASQGLRYLRNLGAVKTIYVAGDRRDHFEAEMELRNLVSGFLREQLAPHFAHGFARLSRIESLARALPGEQREQVTTRLNKLRQWQRSGKQLLPLAAKLLTK